MERDGSQLKSACEAAVLAGVPGLSYAIADRDGVREIGAVGMASLARDEVMTPAHCSGVGSITKTFVAVVILQLIEAGRLHLEDSASAYLQDELVGVANGDLVRVSHLLGHTSGITSWEDDPLWIWKARGRTCDPWKVWGRTETIDYIRGLPALATPGEMFAYSNTNYTLLGLLIEAVTGRPAHEEIRRRILEPLDMKATYLEGFEPAPESAVWIDRHHWFTPAFADNAGRSPFFPKVRGDLLDVSMSNLSVEWTAGGLVSTAFDMVRFGVALRDGVMLSAQSRRAMMTCRLAMDGMEAGLGIFRDVSSGAFGHTGDVLGSDAALHISKDGRVSAILSNVGSVHARPVPANAAMITRTIE